MAVQWLRFAQQGGSGLPGSLSISVSTGSADCLVVFTLAANNLGDANVDSVVFNTSESLTALASGGQCTMWVLANPTQTVADVVVTVSGSGDCICVFGVTVLNGVDASAPIGTAGSFSGFSAVPSFTLSGVQRNDYVVAAFGLSGLTVPATTIGDGQEKRFEITNGPNADGIFLKLTGSHQPGIRNSTRTCNVTHSSARTCACVGAPVLPEPFYRPGSPDHVYSASQFHASAPDHVLAPTLIANPN